MYPSSLRQALVALVLAVCFSAWAAPTGNVDCFVQCRGGDCSLAGAGNATATVKSAKVTHLESCGQWQLVAGSAVEGRFRSARGTEQFVVRATDKRFADAVPGLSKGLCSASRSCMESGDVARVAAVAGKGIGVRAGKRTGSPCEIGLPCGLVLRPGGAMSIPLRSRVADSGVLRVTNQDLGTSQQFAVRAGLVEVPAGAWVAGAAYAYSLQDGSGNEVAAGHFSVMSARMQADVEAELAALRAKNSDASGIDGIEILLDNELFWDAQLRAR